MAIKQIFCKSTFQGNVFSSEKDFIVILSRFYGDKAIFHLLQINSQLKYVIEKGPQLQLQRNSKLKKNHIKQHEMTNAQKAKVF